jgi:hypothetical protein
MKIIKVVIQKNTEFNCPLEITETADKYTLLNNIENISIKGKKSDYYSLWKNIVCAEKIVMLPEIVRKKATKKVYNNIFGEFDKIINFLRNTTNYLTYIRSFNYWMFMKMYEMKVFEEKYINDYNYNMLWFSNHYKIPQQVRDFFMSKIEKTDDKICEIEPKFLISVIVVRSNVWEENLQKCLNSIEKQTYPKDKIEVIFTDTSNPYFRNDSVEKAKGKYFIFVNAKDELTPNALSVLAGLAKEDIDVVQGNCAGENDFSNFGFAKFVKIDKNFYKDLSLKNIWLKYFLPIKQNGIFVPYSMDNKLIKKSFVQDNFVWWEKFYEYEDLYWSFIASYWIGNIAFSTYYSSIIHKDNVLESKISPKEEQKEFFIKICREFLFKISDDNKINGYVNLVKDIMNKNKISDENIQKLLDFLTQKQEKKNWNDYFKLKLQYMIKIASKEHPKILSKYKNKYCGQESVIFATGPSAKYYIPVKNAVHIGMKNAFLYDKVKFDFMFIAHRSHTVRKIKEYGKDFLIDCFITHPIDSRNDVFPNEWARRSDFHTIYHHPTINWELNNFVLSPSVYSTNIENNLCSVNWGVTTIAFQFALFAGFEKIYLVGCDCFYPRSPKKSHFYKNDKISKGLKDNLKSIYFETINANFVLGWKAMREFQKTYYPQTEVISINPVGLKGLFDKDIYTDSYLDEKKGK